MSLHTVRWAEVPEQPWRNGGGRTRELLVWPAPAAGGAGQRGRHRTRRQFSPFPACTAASRCSAARAWCWGPCPAPHAGQPAPRLRRRPGPGLHAAGRPHPRPEPDGGRRPRPHVGRRAALAGPGWRGLYTTQPPRCGPVPTPWPWPPHPGLERRRARPWQIDPPGAPGGSPWSTPMTPPQRTLWRGAHLATLSPDSPWGWIPDGAIVTEGERIAWVGPAAALPAGLAVDAEHDWGGASSPRPDRLPHPPGLWRQPGARVRAAPAGRQLRGDRLAPAAASARPCRPPATPATPPCWTPRWPAPGCCAKA
jgi:hypothetical protein